MAETIQADLCIIGAGAGGLSLAAGASLMGATVVLIERGAMGGDCLHYGCVPSKALLAAAAQAAAWRGGADFGLASSTPTLTPAVDFAQVRAHVSGVVAGIAPQDSRARFEALGVRVIAGQARFTAPDRVEAAGLAIAARRFVVATGSGPLVPALPGLGSVPYLTNETIFANPVLPTHLLVLGGGPAGLELAQAHRRLGARVSVLERARILGHEDPELAAILAERLTAEGIALLEGVSVEEVARRAEGIVLRYRSGGQEQEIAGSHLLIAVGRKANIADLDLSAAGIAWTEAGITVDARLQTSNRRVYAIGDAVGGPNFTHLANHHAGIVLRNVLFRLPAKVGRHAIPRVTYTDPELAAVGLSEAAARESSGPIRILRQSYYDNDRAQTGRRPHGLLKAIIGRRGRILGAAIVGERAGELIQPWVLAMDRKLKIGALATMIAPYPTLSELTSRAAGSYFLPALLGRRSRAIVRFLARFG